MSYPPKGSLLNFPYTQGQGGVPVFASQDASGTVCIPTANYTNTEGVWAPAPTTSEGIPQVGLTGSLVLYDGQESVTTTAAALPAQAGSEIFLQADPSNSANILIGNASSQHTVLQAGQSIDLSLANLALIYARSVSGTQKLNYLVRG